MPSKPIESKLHWKVDPATMPYVRVTEATQKRQSRVGSPVDRGEIWHSEGRIVVGWAETDELSWGRRIFWLKPEDRALDPEGVYKTGCPVEAVDPLTLAPNKPGKKNGRALNGHITAGRALKINDPVLRRDLRLD